VKHGCFWIAGIAAYFCSQPTDVVPAAIATASAIMAYQIRSKEEIVKEVETSNSNLIVTIETKEQEFKN